MNGKNETFCFVPFSNISCRCEILNKRIRFYFSVSYDPTAMRRKTGENEKRRKTIDQVLNKIVLLSMNTYYNKIFCSFQSFNFALFGGN